MRYLVTRKLKDPLKASVFPTRPVEFQPAQEKELLDFLKKLDAEGGWDYKIEVCYTIDKSEIIAPS